MCGRRSVGPDRAPSGFGLVEVMVGVVIALVTMLAVHRVVIASETTRRTAQSDAEAQQAAQFALSRISFDVANAGAGIVTAARALAACPVTGDFTAMTRPVAVVITSGGASDVPDSVVVRYAVGNATVLPARFAVAAPSGASFALRAAMGFAAGDQVIVSDRRGACARTTVTATRGPVAGTLDVDHDIIAADMPADAIALDLGSASRTVATRYDVAAGTLRTTDLQGGDAPNPLASNVVNFKVQYGLDTNGDGALDTWAEATPASGAGDWSSNAVLRATAETLARIKALRVGIIVRGEQIDRAATRAFDWVMFDCEAVDKSTCPGRLAGSIAASARGGWHYRVYETVVPSRNLLWNPV
jgi:type IV pilus assembly protein PilW